MTYILVAAGPIENIPPLIQYQEQYPQAKWIGVDRGTYYLISQHIIPYRAFGDFDSINTKEREEIEKEKLELSTYPSEKDATDLEIAIDWVIKQGPKKVIILGGTGGRLDHFLMNVQLLEKGLEQHTEMVIVDKGNRIQLKEAGEYEIGKSEYKYISLLPLSKEVTGLYLTGFRYPLSHENLKQGTSLCISNELIEETGKISFQTGKLLIIESNDLL